MLAEADFARGRRLFQVKEVVQAQGTGQVEEILQYKVIHFKCPAQMFSTKF